MINITRIIPEQALHLLNFEDKIIAMALTELHLKIDGMSCGHCERTVDTAIRSLDGIVSVNISAKSGMATVLINDALVSPVQILAAIEDTGVYKGHLVPA